jgi:hypothetical protein
MLPLHSCRPVLRMLLVLRVLTTTTPLSNHPSLTHSCIVSWKKQVAPGRGSLRTLPTRLYTSTSTYKHQQIQRCELLGVLQMGPICGPLECRHADRLFKSHPFSCCQSSCL